MHLGISVLHSRPYHPQTLGKLERFHRSLKSELLQGRTFTDLGHCQLAFDTWRDFYNLERPHHALYLDTPITRYTPSPRPFPETLPAVAYAPDDLVRSVDVSGRISFQGRRLRVGRAFTHKQVALRPTQTDGVWDVHFSIQRVKTIDLREQNVLPISPVCTRITYGGRLLPSPGGRGDFLASARVIQGSPEERAYLLLPRP